MHRLSSSRCMQRPARLEDARISRCSSADRALTPRTGPSTPRSLPHPQRSSAGGWPAGCVRSCVPARCCSHSAWSRRTGAPFSLQLTMATQADLLASPLRCARRKNGRYWPNASMPAASTWKVRPSPPPATLRASRSFAYGPSLMPATCGCRSGSRGPRGLTAARLWAPPCATCCATLWLYRHCSGRDLGFGAHSQASSAAPANCAYHESSVPDRKHFSPPRAGFAVCSAPNVCTIRWRDTTL